MRTSKSWKVSTALFGWQWSMLLLFSSCIHQVYAEPRSLFIWGPLSTEYVAETAQFGNPLNQPLPANLMLPPDNPWLCEYPASLENVTEADLALDPRFQFPQDVALFVSINRCSAETKARVAVKLQKRISERIKLLVLYSTNPQEFNFVSLTTDSGNDPEDLQSMGIVYIPHRYASGIDLRMRMQYQGDDPRLGYDGSQHWNFPIELTELSDNARPRRENPSYNGGDIYWFRIILFSLLIASPCCRACYLWYAGGGRLHWRRNERGRIVGIQYIPPMPLWLTTGRPPHDGPAPVGVLTEEEFNNLPEIVYTGVPEKDGSDTEEEQEEQEENSAEDASGDPHTWSNVEVKSGTDQNDVLEQGTSSDVDVEAGEADPLETQADHSETAAENLPIEASTKDTKADENELAVEKIPENKLKDEGFLKEKEKEDPVKQTTDGDFLKNTNELPPEKNDDPLESAENSEHGSVGGQAKSLTSGDFSQMPEEEIVFNGTIDRSSSDALNSSDDSEDESDEGNAIVSETPPSSDTARTSSEAEPKTHGTASTAPVLDSVQGEVAVVQGDQAGNDAEATNSPQENLNATSAGESASENVNESNRDGESPPVDSPPVDPDNGESAGSDDKQTTSTACAICIDEFETGERLTLLPRCKHAFHRECIHAWLIERQGCCPLCKTDVLEPDPNNSPGELDLEAPAEQRFMISSM